MMFSSLLYAIACTARWFSKWPSGLNLLAAFCFAAALVWVLGPWTIERLRRLGPAPSIREDTPDRHRKTKSGTPSMGGLLLIGAALAAALLLSPDRAQARLISFATAALVVLGFVDDRAKVGNELGRGFRAREKLALQGIIGLAVSAEAILWLHRSPSVLSLPAVVPVGILVGALIVMAASNAVNLTDGLDGLAAGCSAAAFGAMAVITNDRPGVAITCAAFAGACLGFLRYNRYPARVFMGDTGSLALGGALAAAALVAEKEWFLLIAGLPFVVEALSVIFQVISFQTTGRRIFRMSPIHHHFELAGWAEPKIVRGFWVASVVAAAAAVIVHSVWG